MIRTLASTRGPAPRIRPLAFTLIELPLVLAIIVVCVGVLLPAVQRTREADNQTAAQADLLQVFTAEKTYFQAHTAYTNSFSLLGLGSKFPNNSADGYIFAIVVSSTLYTVTALPVTAGLNGSTDFTMPQTGKITASPDPAAEAEHAQVTQDIANTALQVMAQCITESDTTHIDISTITQALKSPNTAADAFGQIAPNGKLTVNSILNYSGLGSTEMAPLLTEIQNDFQFGTGGENTGAIGLTMKQTFEIDDFSFGVEGVLNVSGGSSSQPSAGKISFSDFTIGTEHEGPKFTLRNPQFYTGLTLFQPGNNGFVWTGPLTLTDIYGHATGGIIVGELLPAVQAGAKGPTGEPHFHALVLALNATGVMTSGAGWGTLNFAFPALGDPVTGSLILMRPK